MMNEDNEKKDGRILSPRKKIKIREKIIQLYKSGKKIADIKRETGCSRYVITSAIERNENGMDLEDRSRGRKCGQKEILSQDEQERIKRYLNWKQRKFHSLSEVQIYIKNQHEKKISLPTISKYLKKWGVELSPKMDIVKQDDSKKLSRIVKKIYDKYITEDYLTKENVLNMLPYIGSEYCRERTYSPYNTAVLIVDLCYPVPKNNSEKMMPFRDYVPGILKEGVLSKIKSCLKSENYICHSFVVRPLVISSKKSQFVNSEIISDLSSKDRDVSCKVFLEIIKKFRPDIVVTLGDPLQELMIETICHNKSYWDDQLEKIFTGQVIFQEDYLDLFFLSHNIVRFHISSDVFGVNQEKSINQIKSFFEKEFIHRYYPLIDKELEMLETETKKKNRYSYPWDENGKRQKVNLALERTKKIRKLIEFALKMSNNRFKADEK